MRDYYINSLLIEAVQSAFAVQTFNTIVTYSTAMQCLWRQGKSLPKWSP